MLVELSSLNNIKVLLLNILYSTKDNGAVKSESYEFGRMLYELVQIASAVKRNIKACIIKN